MRIKIWFYCVLAAFYVAYLGLKCLILRKNFSNELEAFLDCGDQE